MAEEESSEDERAEELKIISSIFPEMKIDYSRTVSGCLHLPVEPRTPSLVRFDSIVVDTAPTLDLVTRTLQDTGKDVTVLPFEDEEQTEIHRLSHLPALRLDITLPDGYPSLVPPQFNISTQPPWLSDDILKRLHAAGEKLWVEYGHAQIIFAYIDYIQQEAENGFGLVTDEKRPLRLPHFLKAPLLEYERRRKREIFEQTTFDCGICLEPKKGSECHRLSHCGHVFCTQCLQDFYTAAITQGDVDAVKCLETGCGTENMTVEQRRQAKERPLHPKDLLAIPLSLELVQRYVDLKIQKKLEVGKNVIYCPRSWCGAVARTARHAKYLAIKEVTDYPESDEEAESEETGAGERLAVCSKCTFAFCRICHASWHGDFVNCKPKDSDSIAEEDKLSYDYIRLYTSPCPTCDSPVQKTLGCNHMQCWQCRTHFCYLCGAWLDARNPYQHFNTIGFPCYAQLWVLEEGDEGEGNNAAIAEAFGGARAAEIAAVAHERREARAMEAVEAMGLGAQHDA